MKLCKTPILQQQPTPHSCVPACLAMALNKPVDKVLSEMDKLGIDTSTGVSSEAEAWYLMTKRIVTDRFMNRGLGLAEGHYLFTVNSLNIVGLSHCVFVHIRDLEVCVYDPNNRKKDKKFYDFDDFNAMPAETITMLTDHYVKP